MKYYLAIDIGASSGRHLLGWLENGKILMKGDAQTGCDEYSKRY